MGTDTLRLNASAAAARLGISIKALRLYERHALLTDAARAHVPVSLSVLHGNPARRLYERLGFRVASETDTSANMIWRA